MKKITSVLTALLFLTAVSCGNNTKEEKPETPQNYTAEKLSDIAMYKKENIMLPSEMQQVYTFMPYNNSSNYLLLGFGSKSPEFWKVNADFTEFETVEFPEFDIGKAYDLDAGNDGTVTVFVNHVDYGDLEPVGLYEYPENYDEAEYDAAAEYKFMIKTFNMNGELVSSADVKGYGGTAEKSSMINGVYTDSNIVIAGLSGTYEIFSTDGTYIGELSADDGDIDTIGHDKDGRLICTVAYKENETDKLKICLINPDGTLTDYNNTVYDFSETPQGIQQGSGDYSFFLYSRSTLFGIKNDTAEIVPLININVSGISSDSLKGIFLMDDGSIAIMSNNYTDYSVDFRKYIPRTTEEMEGIPVLTYGVCSGEGQEKFALEKINEWNDMGKDFMLELKFYTENYDNPSIVLDEISQDALSGNLPDIMETYNGRFGDINLAEKGSFCDLYEFIDSDETFNRDCFVPNVLECIEKDGKLYSLPNRFALNLGLFAKTKFVGSAEEWSFDKYVDMIINPPIETETEYDSKHRRVYMIRPTEWIDIQNASCSYTDQTFIRFLEWCSEAESLESVYPTMEEYENMSDEERRADYIEQQRLFIDDKAVFTSNTLLASYENYVRTSRGEFNGEPITYLETPSIDPWDELSVSADSEYKEFAWEYIKSRCTDEFYTVGMSDNSFTGPFPVTKTGLEYYGNFERTHYTDYTKFAETKDDPEWKDYKGVVYQLDSSIYQNCIKCGEITDEDVKTVNEFIAAAKPDNKRYINPGVDFYQQFYNIYDEETDRFFNGDCTAEECAEVLQNRANIYLSEKLS